MTAFLAVLIIVLALFCLPLLIPNSVASLRAKADIYSRKYLYLSDFFSNDNALCQQQVEQALEQPKRYLEQYGRECNFLATGFLLQTQHDELAQQAYLPVAALVSALMPLQRVVLIDKQLSAFESMNLLAPLLNGAGLHEFDCHQAASCENAWAALVDCDASLQRQGWCLLWIWMPSKHYAVSLCLRSAWQPLVDKTQGFDGWGDIRNFQPLA